MGKLCRRAGKLCLLVLAGVLAGLCVMLVLCLLLVLCVMLVFSVQGVLMRRRDCGMVAGRARNPDGGGKPLQGQRGHDKPKQQCLDPGFHDVG